MNDDEKVYLYDRSEMLKRQRDMAEEERDGWKIRAMQSEQQRQSLRDQLILAEGQRDQAKASVEDIVNNWQRTYDHDCKKLIQRAEAAEAERKEALTSLDKSRAFKNGLLVERNALRDENDGMHMTNLRIVRELAEARAEREALLVVNGDLARDNETLEAECEALRKVDDAMVERAWKYLEIIAIEKSYGMLSGIDKEYLRNALTAALAVQPTTGAAHE